MHLVVGRNEHRNHISGSFPEDIAPTSRTLSHLTLIKSKPEMPMKKQSSRDLINDEDEGKDTDQCEPHLRLPVVLSFATKNRKGAATSIGAALFFFGYGSSLF